MLHFLIIYHRNTKNKVWKTKENMLNMKLINPFLEFTGKYTKFNNENNMPNKINNISMKN